MRAVVVGAIAVWSHVAVADNFFDLGKAQVGILDDHVLIRLPRAMEFDPKSNSATLDYGTARFTMRATPVEVDEKLDVCAAAQTDLKMLGVARGTPNRLALASPLVGCTVTPRAPRFGDDLLFAAYFESPDGMDAISFFVDDLGLKDQVPWLTLARRIVATVTLPSHQIGELTVLGGTVTPFDSGWLLSTRGGSCRLSDHDEHAKAKSKYIGRDQTWTFWKADAGPDLIATATIENLHADCHARTDRGLAALRATVETLHR
jgi:hypothetical protein